MSSNFSVSEFNFIFNIYSFVEGFIQKKVDHLEAMRLLEGCCEDKMFNILRFRIRFLDKLYEKIKRIDFFNKSSCFNEFKEDLEECFLFLKDSFNSLDAFKVDVFGLDDLCCIEFSDSDTYDMKLSFEERKFSFFADVAYFKIEKQFVDIKSVIIKFIDWTDYYAVQVFTEESGKDHKYGSDFFEPLVDLPFFKVSKEKNAVEIFGSGEFVYDDFEYHFVNPKVSGTFEWDRKLIP